MTAEVSLGFREGLKSGAPRAVLFYLNDPVEDVYAWSGVGPLDYDGHEWKGIGTLGKITGITEKSSLAVRQIAFELRGVPPDAAQFIGKNLRNKVARAWLTVLDGNNQVYGGPFLTADSLIDYQEMPVGDDGNVTARLLANVGFFSIERSQQLVWSHEQQQEDYPGDTGLSLIPSLIDKDVKWRLS